MNPLSEFSRATREALAGLESDTHPYTLRYTTLQWLALCDAIDAMQEEIAMLTETLESRERTIEGQRDALLATRADAERYRWLQANGGCGNEQVPSDEGCYLQLNPRDMDAAIDAARAKEGK